MNYKALFLSTALLLAGSTSVFAQFENVEFKLTGVGRAIVTSNQLNGNLVEFDQSSAQKGASGYQMFDLGTHLEADAFRASAILRVRNPFGSFFGTNTQFEFRQLTLSGHIKNKVQYELGDIYIGGMSPYMVNSFVSDYSEYESEIHAIRRNILNYENFIQDDKWFQQGIQARTNLSFDNIIKGLGIYGFVSRTNTTNENNIPDRILAGASVDVEQSDYLTISGNYVGLTDVEVDESVIDYKNNVLSGEAVFSLDQDNFLLQVKGETGFSSYNFYKDSTGTTVSFTDFFYDAGAEFTYKPLGVKLGVSYRDVGPQFYNPAAQTRRINPYSPTDLFTMVQDNASLRLPTMWDRFTDETLYTRSISPTLGAFFPLYNNITPYGQATPNRRGLSINASTTDSIDIFRASVGVDLLQEIIGEGIEDTRNFTGIKGGVEIYVDKLIGFEKGIAVNYGIKVESTDRGGLAPVDFSATTIDVGTAIEVVKDIDLLVGVKLLSGSGLEYLTARDEFNNLDSFTQVNWDVKQNLYSFGARMRFSEKSFLTASYNLFAVENLTDESVNYDISQIFVDFELWF